MTSSDERARANAKELVEFNRSFTQREFGAVAKDSIRSVGIVGAGMMGASIAAATIRHDLPVVVTDTSEEALDDLPVRIAAELSQTDAPAMVDRSVRTTADQTEVARCDLVLETVAEDVLLKRQLLAELEKQLAPESVLASNTSTIPIERLAGALAEPGRFCGIHFFHPVPRRPLVEIVRGDQTTGATIATGVSYAQAIDRMPLVVRDGPGLVVNRLLVPYLGDALQLLSDGAAIDDIETAATEFGMAMGPMTMADEIGLDTVLDSAWVLAGAMPERIVSSPLLVALVKAKRLGCKSGAGFFAHVEQADGTVVKQPDPAVDGILAGWVSGPKRFSREMITARLFLPMLLEATRILEERGVGDPRHIDLGVVFGLGFPAARGGLLRWADTLGPDKVVEQLGWLESLGPRAQPTEMLLEMARHDGRFYGQTGDPTKDEGGSSNGDESKRPFQFTLRDLFLLNTVAAFILGIVQLVTTDKPIEQILTSPVIWIFCAGLTIGMAILGGAVGREVGAIVCALFGGAMWSGILWVTWVLDESIRPYLHLPAQALGIAITIGPIVLLSVLALRRPEPPAKPSPTTQKLLDHKKKFRETQTQRETGPEKDNLPPSSQ